MVLSAWVDVCAVDVADDGVLEHLDVLGKPQTFRSLLDGLSPYSSSMPARREQHGITISVTWTPRELRDTLGRMRRAGLVRVVGRRYALTAAGKRAAKTQWGAPSKELAPPQVHACLALLERALVLIRSCVATDAERAEALADAVHNLPRLLMGLESWTLEEFEHMFLDPLLTRYPAMARTYPEFAVLPSKVGKLPKVHRGKGHERYVTIVPHPNVAAKLAKAWSERKPRS